MSAGAVRLPYHPRLAEHALVRRHVIDGEEIVVIHDTRTGDLARTGPREWAILAAADGTRDLAGLTLAAAKSGALHRVSEIRGILERLQGMGLLADGVDQPDPPADPIDRPLSVLPDFSLTCDASGACCGVYGSIVFTPQEAARARTALPLVRDGGRREALVFTPEHGTDASGRLAVALVDNCCAYLGDDGRCGVHAIAGEGAKPATCRIYPATFVDDGEAVRVSLGVECPCVLDSVGKSGGAPLVTGAALRRADLPEGARVIELPELVAISDDAFVARDAYVRWSHLLAAQPSPTELVAALWSLADAVQADGLDEDLTLAALAFPSLPDVNAVLPWILALADRAESRVVSASAWRGARDRSLVASRAIAAAASSLVDRAALSAALAAPAPDPVAEAFYLRAVIHGHQIVGRLPLAAALRDRAVRLLVARAMGALSPSTRRPLTVLEAMMRGHGVEIYAREVRP
ncbi:MAG: YkgJ family cysteine cluster protein [Byssovorax sp.]